MRTNTAQTITANATKSVFLQFWMKIIDRDLEYESNNVQYLRCYTKAAVVSIYVVSKHSVLEVKSACVCV